MSATETYPTRAMREALERTASAADLPASGRARELRAMRDELVHLAGYAETLLGDLSLVREGSAIDAADEELRRRENADLREELLRRGQASPDELDALGYHSHDALDEMARDGTLSEASWPSGGHVTGDRGDPLAGVTFLEAPEGGWPDFEAGRPDAVNMTDEAWGELAPGQRELVGKRALGVPVAEDRVSLHNPGDPEGIASGSRASIEPKTEPAPEDPAAPAEPEPIDTDAPSGDQPPPDSELGSEDTTQGGW